MQLERVRHYLNVNGGSQFKEGIDLSLSIRAKKIHESFFSSPLAWFAQLKQMDLLTGCLFVI
jgi:hypothetical protein